MENQETATQVLDRQIADVQEKITQAKLNIADVVIKATSVDIQDIRSPKDMLPLVEDMERMPHYLNTVKSQEKVLAALTKSRAEIATAISGELIK